MKTIPLKGKTSSFLIEILLKDLDILYTKPLFLQKILLYLEKTKEKALEQAENLYYKVIKQENPFKKTRKLSRKLLIGLLKEKGVIFDDKSLDKDFPLKSLLFLYELASSTKEIPFKKRTIPELIKELGFILPNNEEIQKKLISFVKTLEFSKKTIKSPLIPLEFNLTPIFLYFGGISIGIALLPIDIPAFIKAGRVPSFYKGFLGLKPSNIPSNAFIYKGVMRLKPFLKELLQREKQEISLFIEGMWQRVQKASKLPDKLISFAKSLGKRVFKEEDDGIELCLVVILALKLIYGLQNKGFSCLLKENEVILLKTLILSKEKEILDKGLLVKEEFKEVYGVIKEIGELPSLDSILIVI